MIGFIQLHRELLKWEWYTDINTKTLFIHCLLKANFKDKKWRGVNIKRGSFLTGRIKLSLETGLSEQQIRTSLKKLKSTNEITIKTTNKNSIITIVKYNNYQSNNHQSNQQPTSNQPTSNQQVTTTNKDNKDNIINNNKYKITTISDLQFMEITAHQTKQTIPRLLQYLNTFENHLIQTAEQKGTLKDFKQHFTNWLNKQDLKKGVKYKKQRYV